MIDEGERAPELELPAVVDGDIEQVELAEYLGDNVVVLAFYPGDFNPACDAESTGLDDLDLFTMQKDVAILAISADSVYSHRAFADEYDLHIPLLSDTRGEVIEAYGVAVEGERPDHLSRRAVVVVGPDGNVQYAWSTDELRQLPDVDSVRAAVEGIGGGATAEARYRVAHAHYVEGRRSFTSAMHNFEDREWMLAQNDFAAAEEEFAEAADQFNTAVRFAEDNRIRTHYERAERKATELHRAAEWLAQGASAFASGEGAEGEELRSDAESPLEAARDIHEPVPPDEFPPEEESNEEPSILPTEDDEADVSLDLDLEEASGGVGDDAASGATEASDAPDAAAEEGEEADVTATATEGSDPQRPDTDGEARPATAAAGDEQGEERGQAIDDTELEEITAELEEQNEAAEEAGTPEPSEEAGAPDEFVRGGDGARADSRQAHGEREAEPGEGTEDDLVEDDIELDLTDPTEGDGGDGTESDETDEEDAESESSENAEEESAEERDADNENGGNETEVSEEDRRDDPDDDLGDGSHGVPDSL